MKEYNLSINGNSYNVQIKDVSDDTIRAEVNGKEYTVDIDQINTISPFLQADEIAVSSRPNPAVTAAQAARSAIPKIADGSGNGNGPITAPIPGQIIGISISVGDKVKKGQKLLTLEAMKLENAITAEQDGTIKEISVAVGDVVSQGQPLIIIG